MVSGGQPVPFSWMSPKWVLHLHQQGTVPSKSTRGSPRRHYSTTVPELEADVGLGDPKNLKFWQLSGFGFQALKTTTCLELGPVIELISCFLLHFETLPSETGQ